MTNPMDRLADAADDLLSITLATQESLVAAKELDGDPEVARVLSPLIDAMERVRARRAKRILAEEAEAAARPEPGQPGLLLLDAPPELAPAVSDVLLGGAGRIAVERARQKLDQEVGGEGYDAEHDLGHSDELALAAAAYATPPSWRRPTNRGAVLGWPWAPSYWKPKDRIRDLERAGALIAAALDVELARVGKEETDAAGTD